MRWYRIGPTGVQLEAPNRRVAQEMTRKLGIVMDPIGSINIKKDSSFAMLLAAQKRNWDVHYMTFNDLYFRDGTSCATARRLKVKDNPDCWYALSDHESITLDKLDVLLMRKDPPFDMEYIYATYLLEQAEAAGTFVVNKPQSLRDASEKLYTAWFPQCCPPTLVTRQIQALRQFLDEQGEIVVKPLDGMGGMSVFRVRTGDLNANVIMETLTHQESRWIMAQRFVPEISAGDKRILLIDGEPVPYALARIPPAGDTRGNLAIGARGVGVELSEHDRWICDQVAPALRKKDLLFVGLDVIGDYLTEINVTSPTCIRELEHLYSLDIAGQLLDVIEARLTSSR